VPKSGERMVALWRDWVEEKAGADLDALSTRLDDQQGFARLVRDMLVSLDMADELGEDQDQDEQESGEDDQPQGEDNNEEGGEDDSSGEQSQSDDADASSEDEQTGEMEAADATADDVSEDEADAETPGEAKRPDNPLTGLP